MAEQKYIDPCLGTAYTQDGKYIRGPSPRSLDRFAVRVIENTVAINTAHAMRGAPLNTGTAWEHIQRWFVALW